MLKEGDTNLTKLSKLAQVQIVGETVRDVVMQIQCACRDSEKAVAKGVIAKLQQSVPFTQQDI